MFEILKEDGVALIAKSITKLLSDAGVQFDNKEILTCLEKFGAVIDYDRKTAKFPEKLTLEFIEGLKKEDKNERERKLNGENKKTTYSGYAPHIPANEFKVPHLPHFFHQLSTFFYDDEKKENRKGNKQDFVTLIKFSDMINPEFGTGHALNLTDVPAEVEPLEAAYLLIENSNNPRGVYVHSVEQIDYLIEIEEIAGLKDPYWHWMANICPNSPLKIDKTVCARFLHMIKSGLYPAKLAAMPVSGVNIPVTVAGSTVVVAAEFLAVWMAARSIKSDVPLTGMAFVGTMDMRNTKVSFTAFDAMLRRITVAEFLRKWTSVPAGIGPGEYTPTKAPGLYCALEKAFVSMTFAAFSGYFPEFSLGHLNAGLSISPVQFLMEYELAKGVKFLERPEITEDSIALDTILSIGQGLGDKKTYFDEDHTLMNYRSALWMPEYFIRNEWSQEEEQKVLSTSLAKVKALIAEHKKPEGTKDKLAKIREVIEKAKKNLTVH